MASASRVLARSAVTIRRPRTATAPAASAPVEATPESPAPMEAPASASFSLPVVGGVGPEVDSDTRYLRMHRVDRLIRDLGENVKTIGEIDASDTDNLRVVQPLKGRAVTLILGNKNFKLRYDNFLAMADQLMEKLPNAITFDLRLEEQVTAAEEHPKEGK